MGVISHIVVGRLLDGEFRVLTLDGLRMVYEEIKQTLPLERLGILLVEIDTLGESGLLSLLLKRVVRNLKSSIRIPTDFVGRVGNTSFSVILTDISEYDLRSVATRLVDPLSLTVSIGDKSARSVVNIACVHGSELENGEATFDDLYEVAAFRLKKGRSDRGSGIHCE